MRFLLVRPPYLRPINVGASIGPDIGLGFLIAHLKRAGHEATLLDCQGHGLGLDDFRDYIRQHPFDAVGFKTFTKEFGSTRRCSAMVREAQPGAFTLAGGPHPTVLPEETLKLIEDLDFAFSGEAEEGLPRLADFLQARCGDQVPTGRIQRGELEQWEAEQLAAIPGLVFRREGGVVVNPPSRVEDLDELGFPEWDDLELEFFKRRPLAYTGPYVPIQTTRGCPYNCGYCSVKYIHGKHMRLRSAGHVVAEMRLLRERFGIEHVFFIDDHFMVSDARVRELCQAIIDSGLQIKWNCLTNGVRIEMVRDGTVQLMERSGCYGLTVAAESGSQRILDKMHKATTLAKIRAGAELVTSRTKIRLQGFFILGYPGETKDDVWQTIWFARDLPIAMVLFFCFVPHPGTEVWEELKARGQVSSENYDEFFYDRVTYAPPGMTVQELRRLRLIGHLLFYLAPWRLWDVFSRIAGWKDIKALSRLVRGFFRSM